jgi:methylated-DNA-[protein]-cysteine S-methyltransferase
MTSYCIFETAAGFCAIAWGEAGVVRFQLPATSAESAERRLLRRAPEATPAEPRAEICEAIASARRYFAGEETDFSGVRLDLGDQDLPNQQIYEAARRIR